MPENPPLQQNGDRFAGSLQKADETLRLEYITCPLCNSSDTSVIQTSKDNLCGIPGVFKVERCNNCLHRFMNPRPVPECLGACYPDHYGPHQSVPKASSATVSKNDAAHKPNLPESDAVGRPLYLRILPLRYVPGLRRLYNWLMDDRSQPVLLAPGWISTDSVRPTAPQDFIQPRALEIGCATGQYLVRMQEAGWKATGIEPGVRPAGTARDAGLDVYCGMLETCQMPPESFELAAAWMVIEHVPDPRDTLQRLYSLLKPGGILIFSIPNAGCWEAGFFGRHWYVLELPRHLHHFTTASIRKLLGECGFEDIAITHQRNLSNVVGSLALVILAGSPGSRLGKWLLRYPDHPTFAMKLFLAPLAHLVAWIHQGGRLTISARRPVAGRLP